jgi:hypothetical protein
MFLLLGGLLRDDRERLHPELVMLVEALGGEAPSQLIYHEE